MFTAIIRTRGDYTLSILRLALGTVFFAHGAQKMFGWYGGPGFDGTMQGFAQMGIPALLAFLAICAEFFGGIGLIVGLLGRIAALGIMINMNVAIAMVHARFGFFMNWRGGQQGERFEYHLLTIGICLALLIGGSGALSIDAALSRRASRKAGRIRGAKAA